jgi:hypothetical protein
MYLHCSCAPMAHADVETIAEMYEGLQLAQRKLILMPINNNSDPTKAGGSHWYGSHAETRSNMLLVCGVDGGRALFGVVRACFVGASWCLHAAMLLSDTMIRMARQTCQMPNASRVSYRRSFVEVQVGHDSEEAYNALDTID